MKKKILILLLLISGSAISQKKIDSIGTFHLIPKEVVWQKVYTYKKGENQKKLKEQLIQQPYTATINFTDNVFSGASQPMVMKIKGPWFVQYKMNSFINIVFKEDKYKVTVSKFEWTGPEVSVFNVTARSEPTLYHYTANKKRFKKTKARVSFLKRLHKFLDQQFTIKEAQAGW